MFPEPLWLHSVVLFKLGVLLLLASFIPWICLPGVAWLASSSAERATWSAGLILLAEGLFWAGILCSGREVWTSAKAAGWKRVLPELLKKLRS